MKHQNRAGVEAVPSRNRNMTDEDTCLARGEMHAVRYSDLNLTRLEWLGWHAN